MSHRNVHRDRVTSAVAISSIIRMRGCRDYRLDLLSAVPYGHSFPPCTFSINVAPLHLHHAVAGYAWFVKSADLSSFFFWSLSPFFCFHVRKPQTALITHVNAQHYSSSLSSFQPLPGFPGCILHTILSRIIHHKRQYMFIHEHHTVRILDGVIRGAVIYVHPI